LEEIAPTLAYDSEVMGDITRGGTVPTDLADRVTPTALVLVGGKSPAFMIDTGRQLADAMRTGGTGSWRARNTSWPPRYSYLCWRSSSPYDRSQLYARTNWGRTLRAGQSPGGASPGRRRRSRSLVESHRSGSARTCWYHDRRRACRSNTASPRAARRASGASTREDRGAVDGRFRDAVAGSSQPCGISSGCGFGGR
jgi:hypothetical protein